MSAGIKNVYVCPRCDEGITADRRPSRCPSCKLDFSHQIYGYLPPLTMSEQFEKLKDPKVHTDAILALDVSKMNDMMNDALNIIETLPGKKVKVSDIRTVVELSIRIGKIAEAYHGFLQEGGKHVPSLLLAPQRTDNDLPKTGNGGDAS